MQRVMLSRSLTVRLVGLGLAAVLLMAAAVTTTARFQAPAPGSSLKPVGGAEMVIDLIQGQRAILWNSLTGPVNAYTVAGWPTSDGEHDLGGALMIELPENGSAGVIDFGEKPTSVEFEIGG